MSRISVDRFENLTILTAFEKPSYEEIIDAIMQHYPHATHHIVWIFNHASLEGITPNEFERIAATAKDSMKNRVGGRTAFVCPMDSTFELLHNYAAMAEPRGIPYESCAFRKLDEALEWLKR